MVYEDSISIEKATGLIRACGLTVPTGVDYTVGIYDEDELIATGSLKGDIIQGVAVSLKLQGEDLSAKVVTHLLKYAAEKGITALRLFTKAEKAPIFASLGFDTVAVARPYAALLEWGNPNIKDYIAYLKKNKVKGGSNRKRGQGKVAAIVMNCNPFTLGHQYLIETASKENETVYILAVEEELSDFTFAQRFDLIKKGIAHLDNTVLLSGGKYTVSALTFPSYFTKEADLAPAQTAIDVEIFAERIAPALEITRRYIGEEPLSPVTDIYNKAMKERLPKSGIEVVELARKEKDGEVISASYVRRLLKENNFEKIQGLVPGTTLDFLMEEGMPL